MEKQTFYSPNGNHIIWINSGRIEEVDGQKTRVGQKYVEFHPMGSFTPNPDNKKQNLPPYGKVTTDDPEVIAALNERREKALKAGQKPDILTPDEFHAAVVPKEIQIAELRRELQTKSDLLTTLQAQGKVPKTKRAE
jgi:hypothetical protein